MKTTVLDNDMGALVRMAVVTGKVLPHRGYLDDGDWRSKYFANGVHARYRQLTTKWGMKFFATPKQRDQNYAVMKKAAAHGLAPLVGGKFQFKVGDRQYAGYITEHCPPIEVTHARYTCDQICNLEDGLRELGIPARDLHNGNIALKGDTLVAIDLSLSTEEEFRFHAIND